MFLHLCIICFLGGLCPWGLFQGGLGPGGVSVWGSPWGSLPRGSLPRGSLPRGSLSRGVSVQGGLCSDEVSVQRSLCLAVSVQEVSVHRESVSRGSLSGRPPVQQCAGGTQPTGMHSCCVIFYAISLHCPGLAINSSCIVYTYFIVFPS